ncbi:phosphatase PAP2 family protein [Allosphingosinicella flava]|uniref:Phosphatase PAP2 family protein n=1 Tax=Allosphingosinicella flava TaxID=2771430 RepID=A0A7T2LMT0_9SPHN|nr:phosphatase PAP2 family protein [Sphingosinicella flava]QPQ55885.1 phosphatase PAP2 family protein [Sphingosinicella flava]
MVSKRLSFLLAALTLLWVAMLVLGGVEAAGDRAVYLALHGGGHPWLTRLAEAATVLGGWAAVVPASLAGALYLTLRKRRRDAAILLAITFGGRAAVALQKIAVDRDRPVLADRLATVDSASFPSGHAANGLIVWLALALLLPRRRRPGWVAAALLLAFIIGLSRVVLGVHWPSDVAAGWSFGLAWTACLAALLRKDGVSRQG